MSEALFALNDEHRMIRDTARDFAQAELAPNAGRWEEEGWISLGRARDFDWMHVQAARL